MAQTEKTPEDSRRASAYYREVCIPAWVTKWETLISEIDARYDWLNEQAQIIDAREQPKAPDKQTP